MNPKSSQIIAEWVLRYHDIIRVNAENFNSSASFDSRITLEDRLAGALEYKYDPEVLDAVRALLIPEGYKLIQK